MYPKASKQQTFIKSIKKNFDCTFYHQGTGEGQT